MADDNLVDDRAQTTAPTGLPSGIPGGAGGRTPTVFVTDAAAESSRVADTLRTAGYAVVDVPLSMLVARAQVQRPQVVLVDVDASSALEEIGRVRKLPGSGAIDFVHLGSGNGLVKNADDALTNGGSAFFRRPIDIGALVRRLEALTGGPFLRPEARSSTPPPPLPSRAVTTPPDRSSNASLPALGLRSEGPPLPMSVPSLSDLIEPPRSLATFGSVSNELQQLLAEAEARADVAVHLEPSSGDRRNELGGVPSPEEEIETVLPADVLASLDEPIEGEEDEERGHTGTGVDREGTGAHPVKPTTSGGSRHTTSTGARPISTNPQMMDRRPGSENPPRTPTHRTSDVPIPPPPRIASALATASLTPAVLAPPARSPGEAFPPQPITQNVARPLSVRKPSVTIATTVDFKEEGLTPTRGGSEAPPQRAEPGVVLLGPVDARRFVADAIARRSSGALCFEHEGVVRRLVLRDGDLVTAASGADRESLVCFLGARGDLPRDEVERLAGKIPSYGRHAGAALVAHGWLGQDQLWTALRAHAEWIATCVLRIGGGGTAQLEPEPPGRLRSEPSVFAASTGPEIFVELVRRAVASPEAIAALGGEASRIAEGVRHGLLSECALPPADAELVTRARGGSLGELLARAPDAEIASVVHALSLLGILDVLPAAETPAPIRLTEARGAAYDLEAAALDDEAIRARVRARMELVDEGDYFSLLGVPRDATSYEVRRAFVELRRAFEPTRILSPRLVDLELDVKKIVGVLEEAYEILRDVARRERYRKAIDGSPR